MDATVGPGVLSGDGVCGCRAPGKSNGDGSSTALIAVGGLALALAARRRRAAR
jgi:MYXO-CTERM domain-containing protein